MITIATIFLVVSLILVAAKFLLAQSNSERVICIDIFGFQLVGLTVLLAFVDNNPLPLQFALAVALLAFISTLLLSNLIRTKTT